EQAITCLRDRGTMVIVGIYDVTLERKTAYMKDIQVRYSRSYGPGRYDPQYEWGGRDYPVGYVRWTENRNFEAALHLMKSGGLNLEPVTTRRAAFADAVSIYNTLMAPDNADIGVVLEYTTIGPAPVHVAPALSPSSAPVRPEGTIPAVSTLHVVGAGNFARTMLLPHLKGQVPFGTIVNQTALSARHVKEKFGFAAAGTDAAAPLSDPSNAGVVIATRHHLHAPLVLQGLATSKHIFVEKPLCLTRQELAEIDQAIAGSSGSILVGFNRRFAPATTEMKKTLATIPGPKTLAYHVFAGKLAPDHWYANLEESGGRVLGEACHFFDYACHLLGKPVQVTAQTVWPVRGSHSFPDSVTAQIAFADGSCAQVIYTAEGDYAFPKETFRVFASGWVAECENFQKLTLYRGRKATVHKYNSKGHAEEMQAWARFLSAGAPHPLPYADSRQSMLLTFAVMESLQKNASVNL
ncbi:MAG TPA: Gfo/Idh/MocA family oxidoreductase, partial [Verrucomicrobium sp.]|nr:Gfo/Idh/MocA family oxidoreductase [Verrucomicrobium sp.]